MLFLRREYRENTAFSALYILATKDNSGYKTKKQMKKLILIIFLSITSIGKAQSQENFLFGIKGGVNFSHLNFKEFDSDSRTGFHVGILAEIPLTQKFAVQPEILYSSQGAESFDGPSFDGPVLHEFDLDYIQVPITIKYYFLRNLALEAGPSFNFLVKEQITATYFYMPMTGTSSNKYGRFFEFGSLLGLSYNLPGNFLLNTRFIFGITDAFNGEGFSSSSVHNYGYQLGIGYIF